MKNIILATTFILLTSTNVFALDLSCTNVNTSVHSQISVISNADGSKILLNSKSQNSNRGKNYNLSVISAKRNILILENNKIGVKVVVDTATPSAEIYDQQGLVAICE